jgi:hypothetical protein
MFVKQEIKKTGLTRKHRFIHPQEIAIMSKQDMQFSKIFIPVPE